MPRFKLARTKQGRLQLQALQSGSYEFRTTSGKTVRIAVEPLPAAIEIAGPWTVRFPPNWGAPASVTLEKLISWRDHSDAGVRYFSGTAEYEKEIDIPAEWLASGKVLYLDLGQVKYLAQASLNGADLGVLWKPPFVTDVTRVAKPGKNSLKVRVTNLWVNRLIGDEQFPDDCEWEGPHLKRWPQWLIEHEPRPVRERFTFTTWKHYTRDSSLVESGLLGPVMLRPGVKLELD
jgi:hypothetical protein